MRKDWTCGAQIRGRGQEAVRRIPTARKRGGNRTRTARGAPRDEILSGSPDVREGPSGSNPSDPDDDNDPERRDEAAHTRPGHVQSLDCRHAFAAREYADRAEKVLGASDSLIWQCCVSPAPWHKVVAIDTTSCLMGQESRGRIEARKEEAPGPVARLPPHCHPVAPDAPATLLSRNASPITTDRRLLSVCYC
ncbi:hypothetical protein CALCODRAFT_165649 [Calocera cornea HHB12733]|uniref:Uncharacterized protein n=1 Tax=Calocera cornea HHB12733 TaxID=1353952 RepID=A0A165HWE4_9BASI|nr:hypothetical protein CALCODRAFT_165649 [Calocera cornea HHB12733]